MEENMIIVKAMKKLKIKSMTGKMIENQVTI